MPKWITSNTVLCLLIIAAGCFAFYTPPPTILNWDIFGHYIYLPLSFDQHQLILHDATYLTQVNETYHVSPVFYQFVETPDGILFTKYTMGWALLQLPFYLLAEAWAMIGGYETDGFSYPYQVMLYVGSFFYSMLGLFFTRKILLHFFSDRFTALLLVIMVFGTNLLFMYYQAAGQSNHFALFATAWMVWRIICFYKNPCRRNAAYFAAIWALLVLIRPPDGILGLLFFVWNINSWRDFATQFRWFFITNRRITTTIAGVFLLVILPQLIYWYLSTGSILINSYSNNNGEGLDFADPYLAEFLFSFRKGWLLYTPLMLFAFAGAVFMIRRSAQGRAFSLTAFLFLYVIASWTCWWYGSGYSSRAAIDMYPLCMVLMGFALLHLYQSAWKMVTTIVVTLLLALNLFQTYQVSYDILDQTYMTRAYYFSTFLQFSDPTSDQRKLLEFNRDRAHENGFDSADKNYRIAHTLDETFSSPQLINREQEYATEFFIPAREHVARSHAWIKVTWTYEGTADEMQGVVFYTAGVYKKDLYAWEGFSLYDGKTTLDTAKHQISFYYLTPLIRTRWDRLLFGAMKGSAKQARLTGRRIEIFEPVIDY